MLKPAKLLSSLTALTAALYWPLSNDVSAMFHSIAPVFCGVMAYFSRNSSCAIRTAFVTFGWSFPFSIFDAAFAGKLKPALRAASV